MKIYKKLILIIITIFCVFGFINIVNANTKAIVNLSTNKNIIETNEELEITLNIDNLTAAFTAYIEFDNTKLEYISGPQNTNLVDNRIIFVWYDETGGNGKNGELGKFNFKAKNGGKASISVNGEFYTGTGELIETTFNNIQIQVNGESLQPMDLNPILEEGIELDNPNLNLETLAVENILLYPPFEAHILNYDIEIPNNVNTLNILAIPQNEQSKVQIIGNENLKEGKNIITIIVTSVNGEKREYTINAYKRNSLQEQEYIENTIKDREQLNEIYEIEQLSNNNILENNNTEQQNNEIKKGEKEEINKLYVVQISILILFLICSIIFIFKYKK